MTGAALVLAGVVGAAPVAGDEPGLTVHAPACHVAAFSFPTFVDLLRVETTGTRLRCCAVVDEAGWPPAPPAVTVDVSVDPCDAEKAVVWLKIDDPARRRGAHRGVAMTKIDASARPRALALIVAELLRSTEDDTERDPVSLPGVATDRARAQPPPTPSTERRRPALELGGELRGYPSHGLFLQGLRAGFNTPIGAHLSLAGDIGGMTGEQSFDIGKVQVRSATTSLSLGPRWRPVAAVTIAIGARGEVGWAEVRGEAANDALVSTASRSTAIAATAVYAALEAPARAPLRARLVAQGGTMLRGLVADVGGSSGAGISGPFWSIGLDVMFAPWR